MKMKHQITAAALALSLAATGCGKKDGGGNANVDTSNATDGYVLVSRDKDYTPLYAEPSTSSDKVAAMDNKKPITIYSQSDGWCYISYNGQRGYVQDKYVTESLSEQSESSGEDQAAQTTEAPKQTTTAKKTTATTSETEESETTTVTSTEESTTTTEKTTKTTKATTEKAETTTTEAETEALPAEPAAPQEPDQPVSHYRVFVCEDDILKAAGIEYTEFCDFCTATNLSCSSGKLSPSLEPIAGNSVTFYALRGITATNVPEGEFKITGTLTLHRWEWANEEHTLRNVYDEKTVDFTFIMTIG